MTAEFSAPRIADDTSTRVKALEALSKNEHWANGAELRRLTRLLRGGRISELQYALLAMQVLGRALGAELQPGDVFEPFSTPPLFPIACGESFMVADRLFPTFLYGPWNSASMTVAKAFPRPGYSGAESLTLVWSTDAGAALIDAADRAHWFRGSAIRYSEWKARWVQRAPHAASDLERAALFALGAVTGWVIKILAGG